MQKKLRPAEREAIESFPRLARKFCALIISFEGQELRSLLTKVASLLGELYGLALLLPDVSQGTISNRSSKRKIVHRTQRYKFLNQQLGARLGTVNRYWKVFDPPDKKTLVATTLSDDLTDICLDLEAGLALRLNGVRRDDFLWKWRFDFRNHWGRHAVSALTAIHHVVAWNYE